MILRDAVTIRVLSSTKTLASLFLSQAGPRKHKINANLTRNHGFSPPNVGCAGRAKPALAQHFLSIYHYLHLTDSGRRHGGSGGGDGGNSSSNNNQQFESSDDDNGNTSSSSNRSNTARSTAHISSLHSCHSPCTPYTLPPRIPLSRHFWSSGVLSKVGSSSLNTHPSRRLLRLSASRRVALFCRPPPSSPPFFAFSHPLDTSGMPHSPTPCPSAGLCAVVVSEPLLSGACLRNVTDLFRSVSKLLLLPEQRLQVWA